MSAWELARTIRDELEGRPGVDGVMFGGDRDRDHAIIDVSTEDPREGLMFYRVEVYLGNPGPFSPGARRMIRD